MRVILVKFVMAMKNAKTSKKKKAEAEAQEAARLAEEAKKNAEEI